MEFLPEFKLNNVYVLFRYETWFLNESKNINYISVPLNTIIYNLNGIIKIKICKKTNKIISDDDKKFVSDILRFSNGPYLFEKATHIWINNKEYFMEFEKKKFLQFRFNIIDY